MATNHYFQNGLSIGRRSEQSIYEDLIIECLKIYGFDVYYIPRKKVNENQEVNEWLSKLVNEHYHPLTTKKEIVDLIRSKTR